MKSAASGKDDDDDGELSEGDGRADKEQYESERERILKWIKSFSVSSQW